MRGGIVSSSINTGVRVLVTPFVLATNAVGNTSDYVSGLFLEYNTMRNTIDENNLKFATIQQMYAQYYEYRSENIRLRGMLDFARVETSYELLPAEVIQHSEGVLTIDRGRRHGIRESMCVITRDGVIGLIRNVGLVTANVITLQSTDCRIDAMIDLSRVRGQVQGTGNELSTICSMHYIDLNDEVRENDLVVTSPDSVFPAGFPIGRVVGVPEPFHLSQSARIKPLADPFRVDEVFILLAADRRDVDMSGEVSTEPELFLADTLMDTDTIQERYAP